MIKFKVQGAKMEKLNTNEHPLQTVGNFAVNSLRFVLSHLSGGGWSEIRPANIQVISTSPEDEVVGLGFRRAELSE